MSKRRLRYAVGVVLVVTRSDELTAERRGEVLAEHRPQIGTVRGGHRAPFGFDRIASRPYARRHEPS